MSLPVSTTNTSSNTTLARLPVELLASIFVYTNPSDRNNLQKTCQLFEAIFQVHSCHIARTQLKELYGLDYSAIPSNEVNPESESPTRPFFNSSCRSKASRAPPSCRTNWTNLRDYITALLHVQKERRDWYTTATDHRCWSRMIAEDLKQLSYWIEDPWALGLWFERRVEQLRQCCACAHKAEEICSIDAVFEGQWLEQGLEEVLVMNRFDRSMPEVIRFVMGC